MIQITPLAKPAIVELDRDKLAQILRRLDAKELDAEDYETIKAVLGSEAAVQPLRRRFHDTDARGRERNEEVRRDGREYDCPAQIRHGDAVQPRGDAASGPRGSLARFDPMGHRQCPGEACRAGL